jgi:hypothetical protein
VRTRAGRSVGNAELCELLNQILDEVIDNNPVRMPLSAHVERG